MSALYLHRFDAGIQIGPSEDLRLAIKDAHSGATGIEAVQALLCQMSLPIRQINEKKIPGCRADLPRYSRDPAQA